MYFFSTCFFLNNNRKLSNISYNSKLSLNREKLSETFQQVKFTFVIFFKEKTFIKKNYKIIKKNFIKYEKKFQP